MAEEVAGAKVHHKGLAAFFALLCLLFLFFMRPYLMLGDGATARHIATGNYMFGHLKIPTTNYVWALNPDAPWTTHELIGDLLLAADGAHSAMRQQAGIGVTEWDYPQRCMLINVDTEVAQQDITWQQFYPTGPRAFLPLPGAHASLVWYDSPARIRALQQLPLPQLEAAIRQAFPDCLPGIKVTGADSFALTRRHAQRYVAGRVVLLGDAAHTIHPLAGQGVNLGFRDVATLVDLLVPAAASDDEPWLAQLSRYQRQRRRDNLLMQSAMDLFCATFSNDLPPLRLLRNLGLGVAQRAGPLKRQALRYALGLEPQA